MTLQAHTLRAPSGARTKKKRLGRGNSSQKGNYSARGMKGQRARSGGKSGVARLGFRRSLMKMPKLRGFNSQYAKPETVTLLMLEQHVKAETIVTPALLNKLGVIDHPDRGVKIVATGTLTKKISVRGCLASKKAVELIEGVGGTLVF